MRSVPRSLALGAAAAVLASMVMAPAAALAKSHGGGGSVASVEVTPAVHSDVSPALRDIPLATAPAPSAKKDHHSMRLPPKAPSSPLGPVQTTAGPAVATTAGLNFPGVGLGDYGFAPNAAPPDTNGAVGATQYVQWVNESFAVFNKATGALVLGPVAGNTLWSGFGGGCQNNNDGDPVVQYDKAANRWVMTQFSVTTAPYLQCVAVSTTSDATGTYNRYSFSQPNFNDYPKLGVWSDGYYISFNMFSGNTFVGGRACAFYRAAMLAGNPATQICFQLSNVYGGLLPSDLDGSTPPPAGSPNPFVAFGNDSASLDIWTFHADFATPANSTFVHSNIPAPAFAAACSGGGTCIPQSGTSQQLDSLADRLMYRLAYRNFGDHESLVVNHSVTAGSNVGIRWYEIRNPNGAATVYQSGTYAPDSSYRWMGSIAMDKVGNIALGYSVSSSSLSPSIRYTGRAPTDPLGTLQAENSLKSGGGSQTAGLSRWGDYSSMTVDPTDDCTFFYTNEYLKSSGSFNWSTQIASFKFPSCTTAPPVLTTITVAPASASVATGGTRQFTATGLDQFGQPVSPQPTFTWTVSGGGTISTSGLFTAGSSAGGPFTVTASAGGQSGTAGVTVTVPGDFTISASPTALTVTQGSNGTSMISTTQVGSAGTVSLTASVSLSSGGVTASLSPASVGAGGSSTLTVTATSGATPASYTVTVTGTEGSAIHSATVTVTVNAPAPDFTITASPSSQSVRRGNTATYTVTINPANGFTGSVLYSLTGQPSGSTVTFTPNPATGTSALTIATLSTTSRRTYTLTITGTSGSLSHTTTVTLTVTK